MIINILTILAYSQTTIICNTLSPNYQNDFYGIEQEYDKVARLGLP